MKKLLYLTLILLSFISTQSIAEEQPPNGDDIKVLRVMLTDIEKSINEKNIDGVIRYLDPKVNVVFANAEVADGTDAVKAFYARILTGDKAVLKDIKTKTSIEKDAKFYGNTAVAYGTSLDHFIFASGMDIEVPTTWTTTLVKENNNWKVVSLQFTANLLDNPVLSKAKSSTLYFALGGILLGLLLGIFFRKCCRKKA